MSMPLIPPFAVTASYQKDQYGSGSIYTPGIPSVFRHLVTPPTSGTSAEANADTLGTSIGWTGESAANEVVLVTINGSPTGGTWTLEFGDQTTVPLAYNASSATVAAALNALTSVPLSAPGTNDVQTITLTGATGGTWTATFGGQTTSAIAYNASAATVQAALVGLSSIGAGNVGVTGAAGGPYTVTFGGQLAHALQSLITTNATSLTGSSPTATVAHTTPGVAPTYSIAVTGSTGGPYTITFSGKLGGTTLQPRLDAVVADGGNLTGANLAEDQPPITVTITQGHAAKSDSASGYWANNSALQNQVRQHDPMVNFYDSASGNHF